MRVTTVNKAAKDQGSCVMCGKPIEKGSTYQWIRPFRGAKQVKHITCRHWKPSELTSNPNLSEVYRIQENLQDESEMADFASMAYLLESAAGEAEAAADMFRENASNIEEGFGHETQQSAEMNEQADLVEQWATELADAAEEIKDRAGEDPDALDEDEKSDLMQQFDGAVAAMPL